MMDATKTKPRTWDDFPLVLRVDHLGQLFGLTRSAIYRRLATQPSSLPTPFNTSPLEWSRHAVQSWIERPAPLRRRAS